MTDKPSPESAASIGSASNTSVSSPKSRFASEDLVVRKQPPSHVFADEWFEIEVNLEHIRAKGVGQGKSSESVVEFVPTLRKPSGEAVPAEDGASLVTNPHTVRFPLSDTPPRRKKKIRCKIGTTSPLTKDKLTSYVIHLAPNASSDPLVSNIAAVSTDSISIVNYKIDVTSETEWQSVWYKDEGGRDKAMVATAGLVDKQNRPVTGEAVPLQLTLHYETEEHPIRVNNQDILRLVGEEQLAIGKQSGKTVIKFRIEDVSKNHQGQAFVVEVAPSSKAKGSKDIGPGFTQAVSVRSKRNKRQRTAAGDSRPQQRYSPARVHYPTGSFLPESIPSQSTESPFVGADIVQLRDAMKGIIQWTEEVVNGLYPLQWHVIGYAQHPDGSPDYTRPYHNMPNPNTCISRVLSMYSAETRDHLRTVLNAVEAATPSHRRDDSYQSSTSSTVGSGLREPQEHFAMMHGGMPGMPPGMQYPGLPVQSASAAGPSSHPSQHGYPMSFGPGPYQMGPMACRSESRARGAMDNILKSFAVSERKSMEARLHFLALDLSDFESVRKAVRTFQDMNLSLHVLINNAGIMMGTKATSKDGHELMMQANHLGHFLLTLLLLPKLQETKGGRVLTVTSCTYALARQGFDFDDMFCDTTRPYALFGQYAQTKLANILFCKELASRYPNLVSLCIHPGIVRTDVVRNMPWWMRHGDAAFGFILSLLEKTPAQGAYTSVWSAVTKDLPPNGSYLVNSEAVPVKTTANNEKDAKRLWEVSEKLVGVKGPMLNGHGSLKK